MRLWNFDMFVMLLQTPEIAFVRIFIRSVNLRLPFENQQTKTNSKTNNSNKENTITVVTN
jgi:hypothetical protein